jgi:DNA adenine methylase
MDDIFSTAPKLEISTPDTSSNCASIKPAFGYYGAKQRISHQIIDPLPPHNAWVELFCGSAAITLAKKPAPIEVINDLDDNIVNLFEQLRNNSSELIRCIELTPYSRTEFNNARYVSPEDSDLERARKFMILCMMSVNSTVGGGSRTRSSG